MPGQHLSDLLAGLTDFLKAFTEQLDAFPLAAVASVLVQR